MHSYKSVLDGILVMENQSFKDDRGHFLELFKKDKFQEKNNLDITFVQDNFSRSKKGVLRGLHAQKNNPQGKLVTCTRGSALDVVVDINPSSKNFGKYFSIEISEFNNIQIWVPPQYAHGFCALSSVTDIHYKCTNFYDPNDEIGLIWNDKEVSIPWPLKNPIVSNKDKCLPSLSQIQNGFYN